MGSSQKLPEAVSFTPWNLFLYTPEKKKKKYNITQFVVVREEKQHTCKGINFCKFLLMFIARLSSYWRSFIPPLVLQLNKTKKRNLAEAQV